jgi:hypothetical protein
MNYEYNHSPADALDRSLSSALLQPVSSESERIAKDENEKRIVRRNTPVLSVPYLLPKPNMFHDKIVHCMLIEHKADQ